MIVTSFTTFFFFNDTATTEIYTLSLHDALPICHADRSRRGGGAGHRQRAVDLPSAAQGLAPASQDRSEEHTSELQSRLHLGCRLLLEKNKNCRFDEPIRSSSPSLRNLHLQRRPC